MTSSEERADRAESEMLDAMAAEVPLIFHRHAFGSCRVKREGSFAILEDNWGRKACLDEHHVRLAAMALGLAVVPASQAATASARAEAMGGRS